MQCKKAQKALVLLPLSMPSMPWIHLMQQLLIIFDGTSLLSQPDSGEQGLEIAGKLITCVVDLVVVDSAAACKPRAEIDRYRGIATLVCKRG